MMHCIGHHFAVMMANSGQVDLRFIGEFLTHKSKAMTKRHATYLPETTRNASELAAQLIKQNIEDHGVLLERDKNE